MKTLTVQTSAQRQFVELTDRIRGLVGESGVSRGCVHIYVPHTTAGITVNENADPTVAHDILADLERLVPRTQRYYEHDEGNSASHTQASLIGCEQMVLIEEGRLVLGTWQGIFFCEFDGPRTRQVHVRICAH